MKSFTDLFSALDETTRTSDKVAILKAYFEATPPENAVWALSFLSGRTPPRAVSTKLLRTWVSERADLPLWLVEESYEAAGDLAETLALLLPECGASTPEPLHWWVEQRLLPLRTLPEEEKRKVIEQSWDELTRREALVWHKLITGEFRVGVARGLVERALAQYAGIEPSLAAHRLMGPWRATAESFLRLTSKDEEAATPGRPYPFFLASPIETAPSALGPIEEWQLEWKWDGIRAQVIRRSGETLLWSRGEELVTDTFPEVASIGDALPDGAVIDGEIVAWDASAKQPAPFQALQKRLGRKKVGPKTLAATPVEFIAYDLMEWGGEDIRPTPLIERRKLLTDLLVTLQGKPCRISPEIAALTWETAAEIREGARKAAAEGLMIKRRDSSYGVGRQRGSWWKWKNTPFTIDAVMIYAQAGRGRRAGLFTDYTFGVWDKGELAPVAKAYSGLTDAEIRKVDRFIRENTLQRFGPVRTVAPLMVFELFFEGVQVSTRHKSGLAVRFPRIAKIRDDKRPEEADSLETLRQMAVQTGRRLEKETNAT